MTTVTIGDLCRANHASIQTGPFGSQLHAHEYSNDGVPVVPTEAIRDGVILHNAVNRIPPHVAERLDRHRLRKGDILFARRGVQATGHSARVREAEAGWICGTGAIRLRLSVDCTSVDGRWLSHLLSASDAVQWFKQHAIGATMPNLNEGIIRAFALRLPPIGEQHRSAYLLDALHDKLALNARINATLEATARTIFDDWFVRFGPVRAKAEGRAPPGLAPDLAALFPDRFDAEGTPEGWQTWRVHQLLELAYGKALPAPNRAHGPFPVYGSGGINGFHAEALIPGPSVIVGRKGTVGSVFWERRSCFPIDTVFFVRPTVPMTFCYYLLGTLGLETMNTDAAVPGLNRRNVYRLDGTWGTPALWKAFDALVCPIRSKMDAAEAETMTLTTLRNLLLPRLLSGQSRLRDAERAVEAAL